MNDFDKIILGIFITISGCYGMYISIFGSRGVSISGIVMSAICILWFPREHRYKKQKTEEMKRKYNLDGQYSLEELERIRIEQDYQDNFVRKLKLD